MLKLALCAEGTLVEQVVGAITKLIETRQLPPGQKLPSVRVLAENHGISKSTVVDAYDRLVAEGRLTSRPKSGFFVNGRRPHLNLAAAGVPVAQELDPLWALRYALHQDTTVVRPGCGWLPDDWLNGPGLRRSLHALARAPNAQLTHYGTPLGYAPLRAQLQAVFAARGIDAAANRIIITDGAMQAFDLVGRLLIEPGDTVFVDDPCYFNFLAILRAHRATIVGVPFLANGPDLEAFAALAEQHRPVLYITNSALHNPTGATVGAAVAHRLLKLAEAFDITIVEDDIYADFEEQPGPRLAAMDQLQRVIYTGSFSKTLSASSRCGWIAARQDLVEGLTNLKMATTISNNELSAQFLHRLLTDGSYRKHVDALRTRLRPATIDVRRRLEALGMSLWGEPQGGLFLWAQLPDGIDSTAVAARAVAQGIAMAPGNVFSVSHAATPFMRFNVAQSLNERIYAFLKDELSRPA